MKIALFIIFFTLHANDVIKTNKSEYVFIFHSLINLFDVYVFLLLLLPLAFAIPFDKIKSR